jgi:hypothetical protein
LQKSLDNPARLGYLNGMEDTQMTKTMTRYDWPDTANDEIRRTIGEVLDGRDLTELVDNPGRGDEPSDESVARLEESLWETAVQAVGVASIPEPSESTEETESEYRERVHVVAYGAIYAAMRRLEERIRETQMTISYGDSTTGYGHAEIAIGQRGGMTVVSHDGNPRRVTRSAILAAARAIRRGDPSPAIVTTAGDYISVRIA